MTNQTRSKSGKPIIQFVQLQPLQVKLKYVKLTVVSRSPTGTKGIIGNTAIVVQSALVILSLEEYKRTVFLFMIHGTVTLLYASSKTVLRVPIGKVIKSSASCTDLLGDFREH